MNIKFVPEMHDLGKLIEYDFRPHPDTTDGKKPRWHGKNANIPWSHWNEPTSTTWVAARFHHESAYADLANTLPGIPGEAKFDVWLLCLADNLAASSSRATPEEKSEKDAESAVKMPRLKPRKGKTDEDDWAEEDSDSELSYKRVYKLWADTELPTSQPKDWAPIYDGATWREALELVDTASGAEEFWRVYDDPTRSQRLISKIPEDKTPPRVVTSLRTHLELTGKFYRILKRHVQPVPDLANPTGAIYAEHQVSKRSEAKDRWRFQLLRCQLRFSQTPVRARDLNILRLMEQSLAQLDSGRNGDYVLFHTTDTLWLFLPTDGSVTADQVLDPFLQHGFWADAHVSEFPLQDLMPDLQSWLDEYARLEKRLPAQITQWEKELDQVNSDWEHTPQRRQELLPQRNKLYQQLETARVILQTCKTFKQKLDEHGVRAPVNRAIVDAKILRTTLQPGEEICDLCQTRPAQPEPFVDPSGTIVEHLCQKCAAIRQAGMWLRRLEEWENQAESQQVAWVKVTPVWDEIDLLIRVQFEKFIDQLVAQYGDNDASLAQDLKMNFRGIAPLAEFTKEYKQMLARLASELAREFPSALEHLNDQIEESFVVKLSAGEDVLKIVAAFERGMRDFFPAFQNESAIRLSISVAPVKHPFFDHWNYLKAPRDAVNIQIPARAVRLEMKLDRFAQLRAGMQLQDKQVSRLVHTLAEIEAKSASRILVQARLMEDAARAPAIARLVSDDKFSARQILDYYKLITLGGGRPRQEAQGGEAEK